MNKKKSEGQTPLWDPVLRGKTFCAPACGNHCTKAAHDKAQQDAKALAKRLGPEWKPRVWENLGWHYSVTAWLWEVSAHIHNGKVDGYRASLNHRYTSNSTNTPQEALSVSIGLAREAAIVLGQQLEGAHTLLVDALLPRKKRA